MTKIIDLNKRATKAYDDGKMWRQLWDDLYTYALPNRRPSQSPPKTEGENVDKVFDATATRAAFRFAGRVQRDAVPPYQEFIALEAGPAAEAVIAQAVGDQQQFKDVMKGIAEELGKWSATGHSALQQSNFALASGECFLDYFGGQGALLMLESEEQICEFVAVPAVEIGLRENGRGKVCGIYWARRFRAGDLPHEWPDPQFSETLSRIIRETPEQMVPIVQATEYNVETKKYDFTVYCPDRLDEPQIWATTFEVNPWLTPRFYKVPGEAYGRGPGLMALPTIKTLNKVEELTLHAVAFAILGLWAHRNDRVFNPRTARMVPGAMWAVQSTAGPLGPSLQRLEVPGRYDVSNIVLEDLRESVKQTTFDDALPPDSGAVRSATEIVERMKRLMNDLASVYPRLMREFVVPLWQWLLHVLYKRQLLQTKLPLDQLIMKLKITSPIARAQQASDVSNVVDWLQIMLSTGGQEAMMLACKVEDVYAYIGDKLGVPPELIRSASERAGLQSTIAKIIAMQQGAAGAPAGAEIPGASDTGAPEGVIPMSAAA